MKLQMVFDSDHNGGDGWGEHPTRSSPICTRFCGKGRIDGLKWLAVGDMRMRTMHSLGSPDTIRLPDYLRCAAECPCCRSSRKNSRITASISKGPRRAGHRGSRVILVEPVVQPDYTKARDERKGDAGQTPANYKITRDLLANKAKSDAILLHSLPRMDEIPTDVDLTRWSRYWQEAANGVVMRMALIALVLGKVE